MIHLFVFKPESLDHIATICAGNHGECERLFKEKFGYPYTFTFNPTFDVKGSRMQVNPYAETIVEEDSVKMNKP